MMATTFAIAFRNVYVWRSFPDDISDGDHRISI